MRTLLLHHPKREEHYGLKDVGSLLLKEEAKYEDQET